MKGRAVVVIPERRWRVFPSARVSSPFLIYALHHDDSQLVYVGQSSRGLTRPKEHGRASLQHLGTAVANWVKALRRRGFSYWITVLEEVSSVGELDEAERFYIEYFRSLGMYLINEGDGGYGREVRERNKGKRKKEVVDLALREPRTKPVNWEATRFFGDAKYIGK